MKLKIKIFLIVCLLSGTNVYSQYGDYKYKKTLTGVSEQWHKLVLPDIVFGKLNPDLSDIRIVGIAENKDTIEVPFLLKQLDNEVAVKNVPFQTVNESYNAKGYYFTMETAENTLVNEINLDFRQQNFDWLVTLEGSADQEEWFTVLDDYRILSIKNELDEYRFTRLKFGDARYRYFRLFIKTKEKPLLKSAAVTLNTVSPGIFKSYACSQVQTEDRVNKQTITDITLAQKVPVNQLKIHVNDQFDYYRHITVQYLADSFKTPRGWGYNYQILAEGTLNSIDENVFRFNSTILQKLRLVIDNQDNQPLHLGSTEVKGPAYELVARFTEKAQFFLLYGNDRASKPRYDIERFKDLIPPSITALQIGPEEVITQQEAVIQTPAIFNRYWLWGIIIVTTGLLGWFSYRMIRQKETEENEL